MTRHATPRGEPPVICAHCLHVRVDKAQPPWVLIIHGGKRGQPLYTFFCGFPCAAAFATEKALLEETVPA